MILPPPFKGGSIATAKAAHVEAIIASQAAFQEKRRVAAEAAGAALTQNGHRATNIRKAVGGDAAEVLRLLQSVASWLETGPGRLWPASSFQLSAIEQKIACSEVVVLYSDGQLAACMYIEESDETFWPEAAPDEALYLHKLAVDRAFAGLGFSQMLLDWAADYARGKGLENLRLDCAPREKLVGVPTSAKGGEAFVQGHRVYLANYNSGARQGSTERQRMAATVSSINQPATFEIYRKR